MASRTWKNFLPSRKNGIFHEQIRQHDSLCAVSRDDEVIIPDGNYVIKTGDHLYITGSHRDLTRFCLDIGIITKQIKKVMIIGGGKIAFYLAKQLSVLGMRVKIIENNTEHCKVLAKNYLLLQSLMQMVVMKKYQLKKELKIQMHFQH